MGNFLRNRHPLTDESSFVQGAGRVLIAPGQGLTGAPAAPDDIGDVLVLATGANQYDPQSGWIDVGYTKTGINITRNNAEEDFDVDQVRVSLRRRPSNWEMSVGTQLAEATLETFALAWELPHLAANVNNADIATNTGPTVPERRIGLSAPETYVERQVAVVFQFPNGAIRMWYFRRCFRAPQETGFTLNKTGEQVSLPIRWNCLADPTLPITRSFGDMFEQDV